MQQAQSGRSFGFLFVPRFGIGALGLAVAVAFATGAMAMSILAGSHETLSPARAGTTVAIPAHRSGPLFDDTGTPSRIGDPGASSQGRRLTEDDVLESRLLSEANALVAMPAHRSGPLFDDTGTPSRIGR